ncbi:MAG: hypothetical protein EWM73_01199 [Nitrospira sp.]|nr:MAG: hypothetical protein EWM73_01199 [Nitrospira sp.]
MIVLAAARQRVEIVGAEEKLALGEGQRQGRLDLVGSRDILEMDRARRGILIELIERNFLFQEQCAVGEILRRERSRTIDGIHTNELSLVIVRLIQRVIGLRRVRHDCEGIQFFQGVSIG